MSQYPDASFIKSANARAQFVPDDGAEVAVAGRSNAGKSSAINVIVNRRQFARTSKTPGRTQLVNFFALRGGQRLVDQPSKRAKLQQVCRQDHHDHQHNRAAQQLLGLRARIAHRGQPGQHQLLPAFGNHGLWAALMVLNVARGITLFIRYPALERDVTPQPA